MKRSLKEENGDSNRLFVKQEPATNQYERTPYTNYSSITTSGTTSIPQPLPGQPPLPPLPPPPSGVPPPPHVYGPVPPQVTPIQTWAQAPTHWPWITQHATPLPHRVIQHIQKQIALRGNYMRRPNRYNKYDQRNNFHRKNRRQTPFGQSQGQFEQHAAYFGAAITSGIGLDWQRNNYNTTPNDPIMNHMSVPHSNHAITPVTQGIITARYEEEKKERDFKVAMEELVKEKKQRKYMSMSDFNRPWKREDAERALKIETEYNKIVKARSLIIKFPDPDLNKDIVKEFHPGIQNIHFQSPSGPRYCFIQMAENVNIDEAIKELEKIRFGIGNLKVERKSLRDDDNPMPEEIDPYILYIGNLPETVNVNEIKSKFPTASGVDVGFAQKMRNTRYAFIVYDTVDESIKAYEETHNLTWDSRSIIVRFRRRRGSTCLSGESKSNVKKVIEDLSNTSQANERKENNNEKKAMQQQDTNGEHRLQNNTITQSKQNSPILQQSTDLQSSQCSASVTPVETMQQQTLASQPPQIISESEISTKCPSKTETIPETILLTDIKEEPLDYKEMEMMSLPSDDVVDDDDDDDDEDDDEVEDSDEKDNDVDDDNDNEEEEVDENIVRSFLFNSKQQHVKDTEPSDDLDRMFNKLENTTSKIRF